MFALPLLIMADIEDVPGARQPKVKAAFCCLNHLYVLNVFRTLNSGLRFDLQ